MTRRTMIAAAATAAAAPAAMAAEPADFLVLDQSTGERPEPAAPVAADAEDGLAPLLDDYRQAHYAFINSWRWRNELPEDKQAQLRATFRANQLKRLVAIAKQRPNSLAGVADALDVAAWCILEQGDVNPVDLDTVADGAWNLVTGARELLAEEYPDQVKAGTMSLCKSNATTGEHFTSWASPQTHFRPAYRQDEAPVTREAWQEDSRADFDTQAICHQLLCLSDRELEAHIRDNPDAKMWGEIAHHVLESVERHDNLAAIARTARLRLNVVMSRVFDLGDDAIPKDQLPRYSGEYDVPSGLPDRLTGLGKERAWRMRQFEAGGPRRDMLPDDERDAESRAFYDDISELDRHMASIKPRTAAGALTLIDVALDHEADRDDGIGDQVVESVLRRLRDFIERSCPAA